MKLESTIKCVVATFSTLSNKMRIKSNCFASIESSWEQRKTERPSFRAKGKTYLPNEEEKTMRIEFHVCKCGYSDNVFSDNIMLFAPQHTSTLCIDISLLATSETAKTKDLFDYVSAHRNDFDNSVDEKDFALLSPQAVYYFQEGFLWGAEDEKRLQEIFRDFRSEYIDAYCFLVAGASINYNNGYRFVVPSNELIHQFSKPHVHVKKGKDSPRYSLETLERFPKDKFESNDYDRDKRLKKRGLEKNRESLLLFWKRATQGFIPPEMDINGKCYYNES